LSLPSDSAQVSSRPSFGELSTPVLLKTPPEERFDMSLKAWRRICRRLEHVPKRSNWIENLGWSLATLPVPTFIAWLVWLGPYRALSDQDKMAYSFVSPILLVITAATAVMAVVLLVVAAQRRSDLKNSLDDILDEMRDYEIVRPSED
jgi:hypothetical protein